MAKTTVPIQQAMLQFSLTAIVDHHPSFLVSTAFQDAMEQSAKIGFDTRDATPVVIGALMGTQQTESIARIPLPGDLPALEVPFRC